MEKEFIHYEQALALKELGFDEPCFGWYNNKHSALSVGESWRSAQDSISAPTFSQAFRWFREKYDLHSYIDRVYGKGFYVYEYFIDKDNQCFNLKRYEEAELECLKKLIEIVKRK